MRFASMHTGCTPIFLVTSVVNTLYKSGNFRGFSFVQFSGNMYKQRFGRYFELDNFFEPVLYWVSPFFSDDSLIFKHFFVGKLELDKIDLS